MSLKFLVTVFASLPLPIIWLMVRFDPFGSPGGAIVSDLSAIPIAFAALTQLWFVHLYLHSKSPNKSRILLALTILIGSSVCTIAGLLIHQDFFSAHFMFVIQGIVLLLLRFNIVLNSQNDLRSRNRLFSFAFAASCLWSMWILMMCYALVTRQEPRFGEAIVYNAYNIGLAIWLYTTTMALAQSPGRRIEVAHNSFLVDGLDFSPVLGELACFVAWRLLTSSNSLTCNEILESKTQFCAQCKKSNNLCINNRNLNIAIRLLKRILEALQVGTIEGEIKWKFVPIKNLQIQAIDSI